MSIINRAIQRLKRDYFRNRHTRAIQDVLATPPVARGTMPFMALSMVHTRDVHSYLVALKSFAYFTNPERVVVVCDPTITDDDRALLRRHVPHIELHHADEFVHPDIPRGGCWERLYAISGFVRDHYVVQLDADTVTVQPVQEVLDGVRSGNGFVLADLPDTPLRHLPAVREHALGWLKPGAHIQTIAESEMVNVGLAPDVLYVRGCAGFTGFPRSASLRDTMIDYSRRMGGKLGDDWKRWGTEQVTSNFLVANAHGTSALPFPKYGTPDCATGDTAFYHFIGSMRFINGKYEATSRTAIRMIGSTPPAGVPLAQTT